MMNCGSVLPAKPILVKLMQSKAQVTVWRMHQHSKRKGQGKIDVRRADVDANSRPEAKRGE